MTLGNKEPGDDGWCHDVRQHDGRLRRDDAVDEQRRRWPAEQRVAEASVSGPGLRRLNSDGV